MDDLDDLYALVETSPAGEIDAVARDIRLIAASRFESEKLDKHVESYHLQHLSTVYVNARLARRADDDQTEQTKEIYQTDQIGQANGSSDNGDLQDAADIETGANDQHIKETTVKAGNGFEKVSSEKDTDEKAVSEKVDSDKDMSEESPENETATMTSAATSTRQLEKPSSGYVVLSTLNRIKHGRFFDQTLGVEFSVDFDAMEVKDIVQRSPNEAAQQLNSVLSEYVKAHYIDSAHCTVVEDNDKSKTFLLICGEKLNRFNFWNSDWQSQYEYSENTLEGSITVDVHYFEDGNMRFIAKHCVEIECTRDALIEMISDAETKFQVALNTAIDKICEEKFKKLRRILPINRQRMDWEKVRTYKLSQELSSKQLP